MKFQVISSGSGGNITYIESDKTRILLDAGITLKEFSKRVDIDLSTIDAIVITHDHGDHTGSLMPFLHKTNAVLYINKDVLEYLVKQKHFDFSGIKVQYIESNKKYLINDITIFTMELSHDAVNCNGFIFSSGKESLAYVTDTGLVPLVYMKLLSKVDTLIIEANHDIEMLNESNRPWFLKQRILSFKGHLSNITCGEVLNKLLEEKKISQVVLAHLSQECNKEEIAIDTVMSLIEGDYLPKFVIAKQFEALDLMDVLVKNNEN